MLNPPINYVIGNISQPMGGKKLVNRLNSRQGGGPMPGNMHGKLKILFKTMVSASSMKYGKEHGFV